MGRYSRMLRLAVVLPIGGCQRGEDPAGGLNGTNFLTAATATNDGTPKTVTGGTGPDWFLAFNDDDLIDPTAGETVTLFESPLQVSEVRGWRAEWHTRGQGS
jgi:hypothetical protein